MDNTPTISNKSAYKWFVKMETLDAANQQKKEQLEDEWASLDDKERQIFVLMAKEECHLTKNKARAGKCTNSSQ